MNPVSRCANPFMDQMENRPQVVQKRQKYWPRKNHEWLRVGVHLKPTAGQEQPRRYGANPSGTAHPIRRTLLGRRRYQPAVRLQKRVDSAGVAARRMWMVCSTCALPRRHKFKGKPRGKPRPRSPFGGFPQNNQGFSHGTLFFCGQLGFGDGYHCQHLLLHGHIPCCRVSFAKCALICLGSVPFLRLALNLEASPCLERNLRHVPYCGCTKSCTA